MRILHLPKWYPHRYDDQDGDFIGRHVAAVAAAGPAAQVAVVFAAVARGPLAGFIEEDIDLTGPVPTWRYYYRARPTGWGPLDKVIKLGLWLACQRRGYRAVRRHWGGAAPSLVHAHVLLRTGLAAWWLKWRRGIPYVVSEHWTLYLPARVAQVGGARRWLTRAVLRRAGALHAVSGALAEALGTLDARAPRTAVIANVVDADLFRPVAAGAPDPDHARRLLHVAAFHNRVKNLSGVLRAVAALRPAWPGLRLRVAGYGPDEAALRRYAAALGLLADGTVEFLGKLPHAAVAAEMAQATALVSFSRAETFGVVLLEARACGRPVVATRVGSVPELFAPEGAFGLLVAPDDEAALAGALAEVLARPEQFDGARLRADATARCGPAAVGAAFWVLYAEVVGR